MFLQLMPLIFSIVFLIGCSSSPQPSINKSNIAVLSVPEDPQTLDPRKMRDIPSVNLAHIFYEGLTRVNSQGKIELALAKSVELSEDGLTYTIRLRDAHWSDGSPITAMDFVDTWKTVLQPDFSAPNAYQLYVISGAKEAREGNSSNKLLGLTVQDDRTFTIQLKEPTPYFLELLSCHFAYPVHRSTREETNEFLPITNGPFTITKASERQEYAFEKNKHYWDASSVSLNGVIVKVLSESTALLMFKAGQVDWAGSPISTLPQDAIGSFVKDKMLLKAPAEAVHWFRINTKKTSMNNLELRKALMCAIDRKSIVSNVTQGSQIPALTIIPPFLEWKTKSKAKDNDVEESKRIISKIAPPKSITLTYIANDRGHKIAQAVQQQWENALDIQIKLDASERQSVMEKLKKGDYEVCYGSWYGDITDPVNFLEIFQYASNLTNCTNWENEQYKSFLEAASKETIPEKRLSLLSQAEEILLDELPVIPLMFPTYNYLKSNRLHGVYFSPLGYIDLRQAYITNSE